MSYALDDRHKHFRFSFQDLVKSHLMTAVKSEVEELKERICGLEESLLFLQRQNDTLRPHVPSDVLEQVNAMPAPPAYLAHQEQTQLRLQLAPASSAAAQNGSGGVASENGDAGAHAQHTGSNGAAEMPPLEPQN